MASRRSPGVYFESVFVKPDARLVTGVPGFVGFAGGTVNAPVPLHRKEELSAAVVVQPGSYLADAVAGFFDNGGARCYVVGADAGPSVDPVRALGTALETLGPLDDLDLVAMPDAMSLAEAASREDAQRQLVAHCAAHGNRLAILDPHPASTPLEVLAQRERLAGGQVEPIGAALYYPWIRLPDGESLRSVPPSGHVAGVFARTDARVGVFKAPANEELLGVFDLEVAVGADEQDQLNPAGVNCLRAFPGRGIRVWGARTLSREEEWRYVNVRRLFLTLRRWIDLNMTWAAFEPNGPRLWIRITRELTSYLTTLWQNGAMTGATPSDAFFVKCDAETNPPELRANGAAVTEIGLAPSAPAEFVIVRIVHREAAPAGVTAGA
jgi:phage tail sheath protein FI